MCAPTRHSLMLCWALVLSGAAACSTYDSRYRFRPRPQAVEVTAGGTRLAQAWVTVLGVRRAGDDGLPAGAELRIVVENESTRPLTIDLGAARLDSADLEAFAAPRVLDAEPVLEVPPDEDRSATLLFPFSAEQSAEGVDLDGLNLRWRVRRGTEVAVASATFVREERRRYPSLWDDPWYHRHLYTCAHPFCIGHYGYGGLSCPGY